MTPPLAPPRDPARRRATRALLLAALVLCAAALLPGAFPAASAGEGPPSGATAGASSARWSEATLEAARRIPVQDGGRVKPLDTFARYTLLAFNHKRTVKAGPGDDAPKVTAIEWLLDVVFRPERARTYPCFNVDTYEILDAIEAEHEGRKKRDRYSYRDLFPTDDAPARRRLSELGDQLHERDDKSLEPIEKAIRDLDHDVSRFEALTHAADLVREDVELTPGTKLAGLFGDRARVGGLELLSRFGDVAKLFTSSDGHGSPALPDADAAALERLQRVVQARLRAARALVIFPPSVAKDRQPEWDSLGDVLRERIVGDPVAPESAALLDAFVAMVVAADDPAAFERAAKDYQEGAAALAGRRGEYEKVGLEVALHRLDPFGRAVWLYVFAFLVAAVSWLRPWKALKVATWGLLVGAVALQTTGIVMRCILRDRPPISTLYETALFISTLGAVACLVTEALSRRGIALSVAPIVGGLTLFVANSLEALQGQDTMPELQAVLDTNFWLATHVVVINIGYMGGLVAALFGHVHVLCRAFGVRSGDDDFWRALGRMTYGLIGFALVFSVVGTILGGIWANDSWGRFWGWDPKENGALLICLAQLAILHARLGGFLKPFGVAMAAIFQGCVVAFSWWGVNLLGIGLHAYGFEGGILTALLGFYAIEAAVLGIGFTTFLLGRAYGAPPAAPVPPAGSAPAA